MIHYLKKLASIAICSTLLLGGELAAAPQNLEQLQIELETIRQQTHAPAIGVALVGKDGVHWAASLGEANLEQHIPANENTLYRIGSASKMFVGVAVMQLVDAGRLSLDQRLAEVLPDFEFNNPWEDTNPILIAHLLEHTTGWDTHLAEYAGEAPDSMSLEAGLSVHPDSRVSRWVPGTRHAYSNTGPVVAAHVVEKITGMSFEKYVQDSIFTPLRMTSSTFFKTALYDERGATSYSPTGPVDYLHIYSRPSSSLNTSPLDITHFLTMLTQGGQFEGHRLLSQQALTRMQESHTTLGYQNNIHASYGITLNAFGHQDWGTVFYGHTGGLPGAITEVIYQPDLQAGYAFMINQQNPEAFHRVSNTLREYLLKDTIKPVTKAQALPQTFRQLDGFYTPINPLFDLGKIQFDITGVMRFRTDEFALHRSPLLGGWESTDYAPEGSNGKTLTSNWSGQAVIAWVNDPVAGKTLQVEGALYKKIPAVIVYGRIALLLVSVILALSCVLFSLWWLPQMLWKKSQLISHFRLRAASLALTTLLLSIPLFLIVLNADIKLIMQSYTMGIFIYCVSFLYPLTLAISLFLAIKQRRSGQAKLVYGYCVSVIAAHTFIAIYLASYGLLPFNIWA